MTETSQFNIGGTIYKVSRSLLESHPESMLAKISSERWQEDPEAEIFIERDGDRFRYVLDYMRDGKVELPITESKASVLAELEYYGIEVDEDAVSDVHEKQALCVTSLKRGMKDLKAKVTDADMDYRCKKFAYDIMSDYTAYIAKGIYDFCSFTLIDTNGNINEKRENMEKLKSYKKDKIVMKKVNDHLKKVGLELKAFGKVDSNGSTYDLHVTEIEFGNANKKKSKRKRVS